jgi:GNAT superfamily N-acetyltransferase
MTGTATPPRTNLRLVSPHDIPFLIPALTDLLADSVNRGAALGFVPPLEGHEAHRYWLSLLPSLEDKTRLLLAAYREHRIIGTAQLHLATAPNSRHRAEVQKLFVTARLRGQGVGRSLLLGIHEDARRRARTLLLLHTRYGNPAEQLYRSLGYREVGIVPGYTMGAKGERYDSLNMYLELPPLPG